MEQLSKRKFNWPYLDFYLHIPFLTIRADLMLQRMDNYTIEYIGLQIIVWHWEWRLRLYSTGVNKG